ncbi:MAG TPA: CBS domain-containing protein [Xanthobacteraceae bacterium]|nr:CBS domain-containing protein [Xanthobacteraceae bacterium]
MKAADVMEPDVLSVYPDTSVNDVAKLLLKHRISAVPVVDNGKLVGIVSEGDLIRRVETDTAKHRSWWLELMISDERLATEYVKSHARYAGEVMSRPVITADENTSLNDVAKLFENHNIKRVPIVRGGQVVGIVSRADLLRLLAGLHEKSDPAPTDDDAIQTEVMKRMKTEPWFHSAQVEVGVRGGIVTIEGIALTREMQTALRVVAENVPGVRAVSDATRLKSSIVE